MEEYTTGTGQRLMVHGKDDCHGHCPIHNPSDHNMVDFPTHWRFDIGVMERICKHGVGHPDPDGLAYMVEKMGKSAEAFGVHGCCGCCLDDEEKL